MPVYHHQLPMHLEIGEVLNELRIAYNTWGTLNDKKDNVIWICHALTANANAEEWWPGLIGPGLVFDTDRYFVVCDNILGSCYGTTGPLSTNSTTGKPFYHYFPFVTIRDIVMAHEVLRRYLNINGIFLIAGGSMGGYQALEWCAMQPGLIKHQFLITTSAKESAWGIAIHTTQRMAIELDSSWKEAIEKSGSEGLKTARAIGMLTYRNYEAFVKTQTDDDSSKTDGFKATSYINYQGQKLAQRFSAYSYYLLTRAMDSHNLARGRKDITSVLQSIRAKTFIIGITSDLLCPLPEQEFLSANIPDATFAAIDSLYGHDGFLVETDTITQHLSPWLNR